MTPQVKSKELVQRMADAFFNEGCSVSKPAAKGAALIAVYEMLEQIPVSKNDDGENARRQFWQQVKEEIEKL